MPEVKLSPIQAKLLTVLRAEETTNEPLYAHLRPATFKSRWNPTMGALKSRGFVEVLSHRYAGSPFTTCVWRTTAAGRQHLGESV